MIINKNYYRDQIIVDLDDIIVIAYNKTLVAKIYGEQSYQLVSNEIYKLCYANKINDLVVKFIELVQDKWGNYLLITERLFAYEKRSFSALERSDYIRTFRNKLFQLHEKGFVHRDLINRNKLDYIYHNFLFTDKGIRLLDVGMSVLEEQVGKEKFLSFIKQEKEDLSILENFILNTEATENPKKSR